MHYAFFLKRQLFLFSVFFCFVCCNKWLDHIMFLLEEMNSLFIFQEHSSFHSYRFNECSLFLLLLLVFVFALICVQIFLYLFIKVYFCLWYLLVFIKRVSSKRFEWCWKREKALCKKVVQEAACVDCGLGFSCHAWCHFDSMLSGFAVAWLVSNNWDCLMSLWKNHALFLLYGSIYLVFSFDALFGLTWLMLTHVRLKKSRHCLYDHLVFDFWCHLMLLLMLLCRYAWLWPLLLSELVAPSLLLALILYRVWALLVHPTPKNQVCHCVHYKFLCMVFASHSK
jgi:hypothetical protein